MKRMVLKYNSDISVKEAEKQASKKGEKERDKGQKII